MKDKEIIVNEDYGQILNADAIMKIKITKDNAKADGDDAVKVNVTFDNVDDSLTDIRIDYTILSGNAVFKENNKKTIVKHTNSALSSTVSLVDRTPGSGTIKAVPYFNPTAAPDPVTYNFIGQAIKLTLSIDKDNSPADGSAYDVVIATLVNDQGKPVEGQKLIFSLPSCCTPFFENSNEVNSVSTTDSNGKCEIHIFDNGKENKSVTLTCILASDPTVTQKIDIHFKKIVSIIDLQLLGTVGKGIGGDRKPGQVRAIITPSAPGIPTNYIVRFTKYGGYSRASPSSTTLTLPDIYSGKDGVSQLSVPVNVSDNTSVDAWVHFLDDDTGVTHVFAELMTVAGESIMRSVELSDPQILFDSPSSPPPAPQVYVPKLKVTYRNWSDINPTRSVWACNLIIEAINGYAAPELLVIHSFSNLLIFRDAKPLVKGVLESPWCEFSTNSLGKEYGEVRAIDPTINRINSNSNRYFRILDGEKVLWVGYLAFITNDVVDCTDKF